MLVPAHHRQMCDDVVSGTHRSSPRSSVVRDWMHTERRQHDCLLLVRHASADGVHRDGRSQPTEDVRYSRAGADFQEHACEKILLELSVPYHTAESLESFLLLVDSPDVTGEESR
jgi:hypothetical protein